ncbi:hypothetical protein N9Y03_02540 [Luminiphilus sp.]|nr:hypothetical protein [Luminiphilus sp.]
MSSVSSRKAGYWVAAFVLLASIIINRFVPMSESLASSTRYLYLFSAIFTYVLYARHRMSAIIVGTSCCIGLISILRYFYFSATEAAVIQFVSVFLISYVIASGISSFKPISGAFMGLSLVTLTIFGISLIQSGFTSVESALPNHSRNHAVTLLISINAMLLLCNYKGVIFDFYRIIFYVVSVYVLIFHTGTVGLLLGLLMVSIPAFILLPYRLSFGFAVPFLLFVVTIVDVKQIFSFSSYFLMNDPRYEVWLLVAENAVMSHSLFGRPLKEVLQTGYTTHNTFLDFFVWFGFYGGASFIIFNLALIVKTKNFLRLYLIIFSLKFFSDSVIKSYDLIVVLFVIGWLVLYYKDKRFQVN